jgi:hypothetical protein
MTVPLIYAYQDWECPECGMEERTPPLPPNATRFHTCPRLHMLTAPLVRAGSDCKLVANEREDYLGEEIQRTGDDGKPYMNVHTEHADGHNDLAVFAPVARGATRPGVAGTL